MTPKFSLPAAIAATKLTPMGAPTHLGAEAVWQLVHTAIGLDLDADLCTSKLDQKGVTEAHRQRWRLTAKQALFVAIDTALACAEETHLERAMRRRRKPVLFTRNALFDALARRWSPEFRAARPAVTSWDMTRERVLLARDQLKLVGVDFEKLWTIVRGGIAGLYATRYASAAAHPGGRIVDIDLASPLLRRYEQQRIEESLRGGYRRRSSRSRLLLADDPSLSPKIDARVAAERQYNVMHIGQRTRDTIEVLEGTRLFLNVTAVRRDAEALGHQVETHPWPARKRAWETASAKLRGKKRDAAWRKFVNVHASEYAEYRSLAGRAAQTRAVQRHVDAAEAKNVDAFLEIKSAFYKHATRRYQARTIWPTEISGKAKAEPVIVATSGVLGRRSVTRAAMSPRGEWFWVRAHDPAEYAASLARLLAWFDLEFDSASLTEQFSFDRTLALPLVPLVGVDTSSSMSQIVTIALGHRDAERLVCGSSFKDELVEGLRRVADAGVGFALPAGVTDGQLRNTTGVLSNLFYGASLKSMAKTLRRDPVAYGAWDEIPHSDENLKRLFERGALHDAQIALLGTFRHEYLAVCRALAEAAWRRDPYGGVRFRDVFDGAEVRWHPPCRQTAWAGHSKIGVSLPIGVPNEAGEYPVNYFGEQRVKRGAPFKLAGPNDQGARPGNPKPVRNLIAPGLIHMLDSAFASHVVLKLHAAGVRDIVSIYDGWLVPEDAVAHLQRAVNEAAEPWFRDLRPFYELFETYLGEDSVHGPIVRRWRATWDKRLMDCEAGRDAWPLFLTKPETTYELRRERADQQSPTMGRKETNPDGP